MRGSCSRTPGIEAQHPRFNPNDCAKFEDANALMEGGNRVLQTRGQL